MNDIYLHQDAFKKNRLGEIMAKMIMVILALCSVLGFIAFLRGERDEYRMRKAETDAREARREVEEMRDRLLLPKIASPADIGAVQ